jgi:hypothetical protein
MSLEPRVPAALALEAGIPETALGPTAELIGGGAASEEATHAA